MAVAEGLRVCVDDRVPVCDEVMQRVGTRHTTRMAIREARDIILGRTAMCPALRVQHWRVLRMSVTQPKSPRKDETAIASHSSRRKARGRAVWRRLRPFCSISAAMGLGGEEGPQAFRVLPALACPYSLPVRRGHSYNNYALLERVESAAAACSASLTRADVSDTSSACCCCCCGLHC